MKTAEWVSPMHPDKICDRISDAILDECLRQDPDSRVAVETMGGHGIITITGEMTTKAYVNVKEVVRGIVGDKYGVQVNIERQSPEIAKGVDIGGAGDQGIMVGYACSENEDMIPREIYFARKLGQHLYKKFPYDGKTQITLDNYGAIITIVASFQNAPTDELTGEINDWIFQFKPPTKLDAQIYANPAGDWSQGGFEADTGLTGRKLAVDNYGPQIPIGGGCFSGKDPSKVDRSAAYMARKMAVHYLKHIGAKEVLVKLAYAIGVAEPVMVSVEADGKPVEINDGWDLTPGGIIKQLDLKKPQYENMAATGHFGKDNFWDK